MSSGDFSDNIINLAPILLDQITFKTRIYTAIPKDAFSIRNNAKHISGPQKLDSPITAYFADPRIYNHSHQASIIYPCGRRVVASNGRRIYKALIGKPVPHYSSLKRAPQERTLMRYEQKENQFTDEELSALVEALGQNPTYSPLEPWAYLLETYLSKLGELRHTVITQRDVAAFNMISVPLFKTYLVRLELYLEIPSLGQDDEPLKKAFLKTLTRTFGRSNIERYKPEESQDEEDRTALLVWKVNPRLLSKRLEGRKPWAVKFYKKGDRIRIEIQANEPSLVNADREEALLEAALPADDHTEKAVRAIAKETAAILRTIKKYALAELAVHDQVPEWRVSYSKLQAHAKELLPTKKDSTSLQAVCEYVAKHGFIDRNTAQGLGLSPNLMEKLCDPFRGFLSREEKGVDALEGQLCKRRRNPNYVVQPDRVGLVLKPKRQKRRKTNKSVDIRPIIAKLASRAQVGFPAQGSAVTGLGPRIQSAFLSASDANAHEPKGDGS